MKMRMRFSLRILLMGLTLASLLLGAAAHFVFRVRESARLHERACQQLNQFGFAAEEDPKHPDTSVPGWLVSFSRKWIDPKAYPAAMRVNFCNESLSVDDARERLAITREFREVSALSVHPALLDGEFVELLKEFKTLRHFDMTVGKLDLSAGAALAELTALSHLTIEEPIEDELISTLTRLPNLKELTLDASQLTGQSIDAAQRFSKLRKLTVLGDIRDPGPLGALLQNSSLEALDLSGCSISANAIAAIENAQSVLDLSLTGDDGQDDLMVHVSRLAKLRKIDAYDLDAVQRSSLGLLANCPDLVELRLIGTKLTDREFAQIPPLKQLRLLSLEGEVTQAAAENFLRGAPKCKIKAYAALRLMWQEYQVVDGKLDYREQ